MFCPKCAKENPDQNKFCNRCGASLLVEFFRSPSSAQPPPPPKKPDSVAQPTIPLPPPPPPPSVEKNAAVSANVEIADERDLAAESTEVFENEFPFAAPVSDLAENGNYEDLSKVYEDAELRLDEILVDENKNKKDEIFVDENKKSEPLEAEPIPEPIFTSPETTSLPAENADDYFAEVEKKYRVTAAPAQTGKNNRLIFGIIAALVAVVFLAGAIIAGWYFLSKSQPVETANENKTPITETKPAVVKETPNLNQPPPEMVYVSGGEFTMGRNDGDEYERPAHSVTVKPFFIDKTEVTCEEYKKFVDATGHSSPPSWQNNNFPAGAAQNPVTGVTWDDAVAFAGWKNKRLPTEEEWEFAARSTDGRIYPWGSEWKPEMANAGNRKKTFQAVGTSGGRSPFGAFDMSGNAWEWTASDAAAYPNGKAFPQIADAKIMRGGYWGSNPNQATASFRIQWGARNETDYGNSGFRCAKDIPAKSAF